MVAKKQLGFTGRFGAEEDEQARLSRGTDGWVDPNRDRKVDDPPTQ